MPAAEEAARGATGKVRTITVGKGRKRRYLRVRIVRKKGPRGGTTVAGPPHEYKGA
jgi:hypothetical protein